MANSVPDRSKNRAIKKPQVCDECGSVHSEDENMTIKTEGKPIYLKSGK